jgi:thymidine phosphorylase
MDVPLGLTAGNALEVRESIEVLAGGGPADVVELTILLAREMIDAAGIIGKDPEVALKDGSAMDHWRRMISAQGGDLDAKLPVAREQHVIVATESGIMTKMDAMKVGVSAWRLGAGRSKQGEKVQAGAGIKMHAKPGDYITKGSPLLTLHTDEPTRFERAIEILNGAIEIVENGKVDRLPLVVERITG